MLQIAMLSVELSSCYVLRQYFFVKRVKCSADCSVIFLFTTKRTQPRPQVFSANVALTCNCAALLTREDKRDREGIPHTHPIPWVIRLELFLESG